MGGARSGGQGGPQAIAAGDAQRSLIARRLASPSIAAAPAYSSITTGSYGVDDRDLEPGARDDQLGIIAHTRYGPRPLRRYQLTAFDARSDHLIEPRQGPERGKGGKTRHEHMSSESPQIPDARNLTRTNEELASKLPNPTASLCMSCFPNGRLLERSNIRN